MHQTRCGAADFNKRRNSVNCIPCSVSDKNSRRAANSDKSVAMSTTHDPGFMRQAASLGAMNYLIKPISAETVHSLWINVFSCRTHPNAASGCCCKDSQATVSERAGGISGGHDEGRDSNTRTPQQTIFQRRIRTNTVNGAYTADTRNSSFEEDFIRQFVPAISSTLPGKSSACGNNAEAGNEDCGSTAAASTFDALSSNDEEEDPDHGFITSARAEYLRSRLMEWSFCPYEFDRSELVDCAIIMIMDSAACVDLTLRACRVRKFVTILESAYYDNPYHNFNHAIDVTQCTFYILHTLGMFNRTEPRRSSLRSPTETSFPVRSILRPTDVIALVVASMCHDLGHPGLNNAFMVRARTQLAEIYNDQSVLENFHAACFSMIMSYFFNEFVAPNGKGTVANSGMPAQSTFDYEEFRRIAVHAILATDMARHFEFIGKCRAQYERFMTGSNLPLTGQQHEAERAQLAASILKCADISNITRPFNVSQRWTRRLNREVTLQGNIEESLGMQRSIVVDQTNVPASQIAFYETCGRPLFSALVDLIPELHFMPEQLENNIRNWGFIKSNQKVPEVPYGLKHASTFDLSTSTRAGSTDSAPDFLPKRPLGASAMPTPSSDTFALSALAVESEHLANYSLHIGSSTAHSEKASSPENDSSQDRSTAELLVNAGVPSPPHSQRSATATTT
ncbi:3',5'-cyclic-nucleotide phosphodiesterase [Coemansia erecta]|nr:3',5'-cyclic-nucleotide phosphodiesterase [Coemansia erecta]KAJ2887795.1 3',5'-cyclic-nucleotide phosphodiesterase [Coemansia asiatica]